MYYVHKSNFTFFCPFVNIFFEFIYVVNNRFTKLAVLNGYRTVIKQEL